jgi:hypothetical protein
MQTANTPALHASPFNTNTPVIVCPRDWLILHQLAEQDAFTKESWLTSLMSKQDPAMAEASEKKPVSPRRFEEIRSRHTCLRDTFREVADICMSRYFNTYENGEDGTFADYYHRYTLGHYEMNINLRQSGELGPQIPKLARLEDEDIRAVGRSFGLNIFENVSMQQLRDSIRLSPENEEYLQCLNEKLGITDESALKTLRQCLAEENISPQRFLELSKNNNLLPWNTFPRWEGSEALKASGAAAPMPVAV